ncbi:hypothetical protein [Polaribacter sp.]|uniref:hypothetical protein n=1 Tax=Polaribacter sp. TaxID=1920175 RepID=UPI003EF8070E
MKTLFRFVYNIKNLWPKNPKVKLLATHHFHDMEKNADVPFEYENYTTFLNKVIIS